VVVVVVVLELRPITAQTLLWPGGEVHLMEAKEQAGVQVAEGAEPTTSLPSAERL
jgi:hypothetical protein